MTKHIELNVPKWFEMDELVILDTIMSPIAEDVGVLVAGENINYTKACCPTVRLYLLQMMNGKFELTKELEAFPFRTRDEAVLFSEKLRSLNALDLIMFMNKEQPVFTV